MLKKAGMSLEDIIQQFIKEGKMRAPSTGWRKRESKIIQKGMTVKMTHRERLGEIKQSDSQLDAVCENMDLPFSKQSSEVNNVKADKE